jgi:hypothetical protein
MPKKGGYKKHPFAGRLVGGGSESVEYCDSCDRIKSKCVCDDKIKESLFTEYNQYLAEYGAANPLQGAVPQEVTAAQDQQEAQKQDVQSKIKELLDQVTATRSQIAQLNRAFPTGADPVQKAMQLKDMETQKVQLGDQIEDLMKQIGVLRSQAL